MKLSIDEKLWDLVEKTKSLQTEIEKTLNYIKRVKQTDAIYKDPTIIQFKKERYHEPLLNGLIKSLSNIEFETKRNYEALKSLHWFFGLFKKKYKSEVSNPRS